MVPRDQRGERCLRLAGALEGEGTQSSGYFVFLLLASAGKFPPKGAQAPQDTDERTKVCAAPALLSAAAFARVALYGSALPFRAVCARRC